jgi:alpha-D-ribose 1-methylphosphonate 5-triphosphate diphosphatase
MTMRIQGGQLLAGGQFVEADIRIDDKDGAIASVGAAGGNGRAYDARGLYVLPGIVDIHADAFERQLMPRPGVGFPIDLALQESDRQAVGNGITTLFHGVTWSWEPGLRGADNARAVLTGIEQLKPSLGADTRCHLRHETYNLDAETEITDWLGERRIGMLGFNDHMPSASAPPRTRKIAEMAARAGLTVEDFNALVDRLRARANEVPGSPTQRQWFRALGCRVAEFPVNHETADDATRAGDNVVMGAPNVVRGGSHIGWVSAADMIARGLCTVLASDYYYPAPLLAPFRLAADKVAPLAEAWRFVSERPAQAAGLGDRGTLEPGKRADIVVVDASDPLRPKAVATMAAGRFVHMADPSRFN